MADILRIRCRGCQVKIKAPLKYQGRTIQCPQCGHEIKIPVLQEARVAKTQAAKPAASKASATAATALVADEAPPTKPKPKPKPKEEPIELGDDAYTAAAEDPWDVDPAEYDDFEDFEAPPKQKKKPAASTKRRPAKKKRKKPKQEQEDVDWVEQGSIWGGIAMMIGAVVWFVLGLKAGIIFYYPPILFILGIVAVFRGFMGD